MTVKELINKLNEIGNENSAVWLRNSWDTNQNDDVIEIEYDLKKNVVVIWYDVHRYMGLSKLCKDSNNENI